MEATTSWSSWKVLLNFYGWNEWHRRWASRGYLVEVETRFTLCNKKDLWVDKERHIKRYMKGSVRIYLRSEDCKSCGRRVEAKINIWIQNRKHDMPSTQLREMQKRRSVLMLNTIKKTSLVLPNKCVQKIRM